MARQISHTDPAGVAHSAAYARVEIDRLSKHLRQARADLLIYHNATTARDGVSGPVRPSVNIYVEGSDFDTWFAPTVLDDANKDPWSQFYLYLKQSGQPLETGSDV